MDEVFRDEIRVESLLEHFLRLVVAALTLEEEELDVQKLWARVGVIGVAPEVVPEVRFVVFREELEDDLVWDFQYIEERGVHRIADCSLLVNRTSGQQMCLYYWHRHSPLAGLNILVSNYLTASYQARCLDVKRKFIDTANVTGQQPERDHIDSWLEELAPRLPPQIDLGVEGIVDRIHGLDWRIRKMLDETLEERGLTLGDWKVLCTLRWAESGRRSAGELARRAELTSGTMTARLDHLERVGLVRRARDPGDRRSVLVELTAKGRKKLEQAMGVQAEKEKLVAAALTAKEMEQLNALLRKLMISVKSRITKP